MSDTELDELPPDLRALLAEERAQIDMPDGAMEELYANVCAKLPLPPFGKPPDGDTSGGEGGGEGGDEGSGEGGNEGHSGGEGGDSTTSSGAASHGAGAGAKAAEETATTANALAPAAARAAQWSIPVALGTGAILGAALHATYRHVTDPPLPPPAIVSVAPPVSPSGAGGALTSAPDALATVEPSAAPPPNASSAGAIKSAASAQAPKASANERADAVSEQDDALFAERASLEIARTAVGRRQASAALDALSRHARDFPRGRLGEERDSLWIQALLLAGRREEARSRADAFRRRYPKSLFLRVLDASFAPAPPPASSSGATPGSAPPEPKP